MSNRPKRALVLGCGGVAGGAWSIACLHALEQKLNWDPREAEIIIGTSAGAVLAALLAAGVSVDQLMACQNGRPHSGCRWDHDRDTGGAFPPRPALSLTAGALVAQALRGQLPPLLAVSALAPRGRFDMRPFRRLIDSVVPSGAWAPRQGVWLMAVDTQSGQRIPLGREDAPACALNDAVCASYGVPAWCPPVSIGGREFIDGGVVSPTSADFLLDSEVEEVVILAPMASRQPDRPRSPLARIERRLRRYMTRIVDGEVAALKQAGKTVLRLEPTAMDLGAIGYNMMDPGRRSQVFATAQKTTPQQLLAYH